MNNTKEVLHGLCKQHIEASIQEIEAALASLREAIHNETKSSMGDKYETTREMLQQDINMNMERLSKAKAELAVLHTIDTAKTYNIVVPGSLVRASNGNFYITISAGPFTIDGGKYYAVSPLSPIGVQLKGKTKGDSFTLNGKSFIIADVA